VTIVDIDLLTAYTFVNKHDQTVIFPVSDLSICLFKMGAKHIWISPCFLRL